MLGDSIYQTDLKIQQINVNKYTYLNNKFPVEIIASYTGKTAVQSELRIESQGQIIHKERVVFSAVQNSIILTPKIVSSKVGLQSVPYVDDWDVPQGLAGNSAYMISPKAAKKLLNKVKEIGMWPNDALMCKQMFPWLEVVYPYYTTIQKGLTSTTTQ